jgi:DNA-binding transcriptional ArsR family regulator
VAVQSALQAINNPARRQILRLVWEEERSSREIASHFEVTWQAVSHNLRVLREAGLITDRQEGTRRLYRAEPKQLGPLEALLEGLWREDLKQLDRVIAEDRSERRAR